MALRRNSVSIPSTARLFSRNSRLVSFSLSIMPRFITFSPASTFSSSISSTSLSNNRFFSKTVSNNISDQSSIDMNDVSKQIYQTFHPIVVENFLKTLHTIFKSSKHHSLIISSIHFRAGNDLRCLLDWLRSLIDTGKVVPITLNREEPKRDNLKDKLTLAYTNYWKYKNCSVTHKGEANLSKINEPKLKEIIHGLVSSAPLDVTTDIIDSLKKITNVPPTTRSKGKIINPEDIDQFFLNIIERHQTHLPRIYPLLHLLDIPAPTNMKAQILLTELDKASEKDIKTLSSLLNRVVKTLHKISKKQPRTPHDTLHCVHMRIRQVRKFEEYCHSKSKSFSPLTRPTSEAEALLIEPDDFPDLLSSDTDEDESNSDIQDIGNTLQENNKLQTVAHFIADSRTQIYENIPKDLLDAASSTNKILIDNLPPRLPEDEFQKIFHRFGGALFSHTYTSRLFEVGQHQMLPSDISDLNKGAKRWSQVQKAIKSDSYAFVILSPEGYLKATRDDLKLFGCSIKGYRCRIRETRGMRSLILEVLHQLPVGQFVDLLSLCFAGEYEITYDSEMQDKRTDYVRLHFDSHESAWIAAAKLEVMLAEMSTPFFSFDWIKTSWYYESANKEKQRKRLSTLIDDDKNSKTQIDDPLIDDVEQLKL